MSEISPLSSNERKDAWSPDDDLILTELVLHHIRTGSTQLAAFDEAGDRLGRTPAACGFRWNSAVRKRYDEAIRMAKQERMGRKTTSVQREVRVAGVGLMSQSNEIQSLFSLHKIDDVIEFMIRIKDLLLQKDNQIDALQKENEELRNNNTDLKYELENQEVKMTDDYKTFLQILGKAKELGI